MRISLSDFWKAVTKLDYLHMNFAILFLSLHVMSSLLKKKKRKRVIVWTRKGKSPKQTLNL
jgi:hypothetical protein